MVYLKFAPGLQTSVQYLPSLRERKDYKGRREVVNIVSHPRAFR